MIDMTNRKNRLIRIIILTAAIALLAAGIADDGSTDIMNKAVMICMECIGLG